jgi:polysaccharide biosynthesis/export protein
MRILQVMAVAVGCLVALATGALAQQGYQIQRGDVLRVEVLEDSTLNRDAPVLPDGRIAFPLVGTLPVAGRTIDQINADLSQALAPNFAVPPSVFVSVPACAPGAPGVAASEPNHHRLCHGRGRQPRPARGAPRAPRSCSSSARPAG